MTTIKASDHWPSLWHVIWYMIGPPRGLFWIIGYVFSFIIPYELLIHPLRRSEQHNLDFINRMFVRTIRYTLGDRNMHRCRFLFFVIDRLHYRSCQLQGYDVQLVSDALGLGTVKGAWIGEKGTLPSMEDDYRSAKEALKDTLVVLYIHGMDL